MAPCNMHSLLSVGLVGHLRLTFPPMYRLYLVMKSKPSTEISEDEIAVTSGKKNIDSGAMSDFLQKLESITMTIEKAFDNQVKVATVCSFFFNLLRSLPGNVPKGPWDQNRLEEKLAKWIVATD
jgi:hypothetical protein